MADPFSSLPADNATSLTRAALVQALYTAPQAAQSGSAKQPGIAFLADPTSGVYLYPDGSAMGFVFKGVEELTISTAGLVFEQPATGLVSAKEPSTSVTAPGAAYALSFSPLGSATYIITPNAPLSLTLSAQSGIAGIRQVLNVLIKQPTTAGFAVTLSMPGVGFPKNRLGQSAPLAVSAAAGDKTPLQFVSWGDGTIEGAYG